MLREVLSGLGAMSAVILLVYKDTLLSFVASVQLTSNDMLRVGDWIEMPQVGADGDVVDITLHTVKVQNFDKTIVSIPTWRLMSESFKNWRGMQESGGRRIKLRYAHVGVANAPPTFVGPKPPEATGAIATPKGPNVDLSAVDPLAPRYKEWEERASKLKTTDTVKAETLPFGGDRLGRDVLAKAIKGTQISVFVGVMAALVATAIGTLLGALSGFFGGKVGDFLEWVYNVFTSVPYILLIFALAAIFMNKTLGFTMTQQIIFFMIVQVTALIGSLIFGRVAPPIDDGHCLAASASCTNHVPCLGFRFASVDRALQIRAAAARIHRRAVQLELHDVVAGQLIVADDAPCFPHAHLHAGLCGVGFGQARIQLQRTRRGSQRLTAARPRAVVL